MMNFKIQAAILLVGIAIWAGVGIFLPVDFGGNLHGSNTEFGSTTNEEISPLKKQQGNKGISQQVDTQMGLYNSKTSRKLQIAGSKANAASQASSNSVGTPKTLAEALTTAFVRNSFANANSNAFSSSGQGSTNTATASFSGPGFSVSIAQSIAIGPNAVTSAGASAQSGAGASSSQSNAASSASGAGVPSASASIASAVTSSIAGQAFADAKSSAASQGSSISLPDLAGKYQLSFPRITLRVTPYQFSFKGCTDYRVPIIWQGENIRIGASQFSQPDCGYDSAYFIAKRLPSVIKFRRIGNDLACLNSKNEELFIFKQWQASKKLKKADEDFYQYSAELPSYNVELAQNKIYFDGYRQNPVEFEFRNPDLISFKKYFQNKRGLEFDRDDNSISSFLASCSRINRRAQNKGFWLVDQKGKNLAECSLKDW